MLTVSGAHLETCQPGMRVSQPHTALGLVKQGIVHRAVGAGHGIEGCIQHLGIIGHLQHSQDAMSTSRDAGPRHACSWNMTDT